ncbi:MAG: hypothetical protein ACRD2B_04780 [Terriglobia bacterium]
MKSQPAPTASAFRQALKRVAIGFVFAVILMIPRLGRLRRNARIWTVIRVILGIVGVWLIVGFARGEAGSAPLVAGIILAAFAILFSAHPEKKSVDALSRNLNALVVLNGGCFVEDGRPALPAQLFLTPDRLLALGENDARLAVIPLAGLRSASIHPSPTASEKQNKPPIWEFEVTWDSDGMHSARFLYEGAFAEHLARVAEKSLTSIWKKGLPVLPSS